MRTFAGRRPLRTLRQYQIPSARTKAATTEFTITWPVISFVFEVPWATDVLSDEESDATTEVASGVGEALKDADLFCSFDSEGSALVLSVAPLEEGTASLLTGADDAVTVSEANAEGAGAAFTSLSEKS